MKPAHLNPTIEKLAAGKSVFGAIISDLSMTSARTWARSGADFVWIDMEHNPLNMDAINQFVAYANDKAYVAQRGDTQPFIINYVFKKLPDGSKWSPTPCSVK